MVDVPRARKPLTARNSIDIARMRAAKMLRLTTTKSALNRSAATSDSRQSSASALSTTSSQMTTVFSRPGQQSPLLKPVDRDDTAGLHASELGGSAFKEEFQLEPPALLPATAAAAGTSIDAAPAAAGEAMTRRPSVRFEEHLKRRSGSTATQHPAAIELSKQMHELELGQDADEDVGGMHMADIVESKEAPGIDLKLDTKSAAATAAAAGKHQEHAQLSAKSMQEYEDEVLALQL